MLHGTLWVQGLGCQPAAAKKLATIRAVARGGNCLAACIFRK